MSGGRARGSMNPGVRTSILVFVAVLSTGPSASALHLDSIPPCEGACIDPDFLERVIGAAEVVVSLKRSPPSISLERSILKPAEEVDLGHVVPSPCIPDGAGLAARLRETKRGPYDYPKALEMALASNDYSLVLFLGRGK